MRRYLFIFSLVLCILSTQNVAASSNWQKISLVFRAYSHDRLLESLNSLALTRSSESLMAQNSLLASAISRCASASASPEKIMGSVGSTLSQNMYGWIGVDGQKEGVKDGDFVLADGVYLGQVVSSFAHYATIQTVGEFTDRFPIIHQRSSTAGFLERKDSVVLAVFLQPITDVAVGDVLTIVPDGIHTAHQYPVAIIDAVLSIQDSSPYRARVSFLATPRILMPVTIIGERK